MEERGAQALPKRRLSLRRLEVLFAKAALLPGVERLVRHLHRPCQWNERRAARLALVAALFKVWTDSMQERRADGGGNILSPSPL